MRAGGVGAGGGGHGARHFARARENRPHPIRITLLRAGGPSRTCNESKQEDESNPSMHLKQKKK